jgi:hypothetical protein
MATAGQYGIIVGLVLVVVATGVIATSGKNGDAKASPCAALKMPGTSCAGDLLVLSNGRVVEIVPSSEAVVPFRYLSRLMSADKDMSLVKKDDPRYPLYKQKFIRGY